MQGLAWANGKTIIYKLFVFAVHGSFYNAVAAIGIIIKQRVANMLHVNTYLVCTPGFKPAFYQCSITEAFQYCIVRSGFFSIFPIRIYIHDLAETLMTAYMSCNRSTIFFYISPN